VWDLDNTLWHGILLESADVRLNAEAVGVLRQLDARGILLSVASKNDPALAQQKMIEFGISEYMLLPQIGWLPKSEGIKRLGAQLNIGLDTFAFVDDNPFELEEVSSALPMVMCIDARELSKLVAQGRFRGSGTEEAKRRRAMYREAIAREEYEQSFGDDFFAFLRSCEMRLCVLKYRSEYYDRLCELVQRTNQLNFSGHKYKPGEIEPILADDRLETWLLECSDKFGSYGVVGCGIISRIPGQVSVQDFMLSCRVQGKFIEQAFFDALLQGGEYCLRVNFRATGRNLPAKQVLETIGFQVDEQGCMVLNFPKSRLACDFIQLKRESLAKTH
jgi:FkbH-like protein